MASATLSSASANISPAKANPDFCVGPGLRPGPAERQPARHRRLPELSLPHGLDLELLKSPSCPHTKPGVKSPRIVRLPCRRPQLSISHFDTASLLRIR